MKKWNLKENKKQIKIIAISLYIEVLTLVITSYMEKLQNWLNIDFHLNLTQFKLIGPIVLLSNFNILLIFIIITFFVFLVIKNYRKSKENAKNEIEGINYKEKDGTHGTAGFANVNDLKEVLSIGNEPNENGIILGKTIDTNELIVLPDSYKSLNRNIFIIGASGAGKSTKFIISNILKISQQDERTYALDDAIKYGKNIVVTDPKGGATCCSLKRTAQVI